MAYPLPQSESDWTEPGTFEVSPGVFRIPLPLPNDGLRAVNVYAIVDGDGVVMIDSGWALEHSKEQLIRGLDVLGFTLAHISNFLVTHAHRDHYTQAVAIRRIFNTPITLGAGERPTLERLAPHRHNEPSALLEKLRACGAWELADRIGREPRAAEPTDKLWELPDVWLESRTTIPLTTRTLEAIPTPGHTQGHVVFLDRSSGILFTGDHVLPHISPSIGFEAEPGANPLGNYLNSLQLLLALPNVPILPAHGPIGQSSHARTQSLLEHHRVRLDQTRSAVGSGADTAFLVAAKIGWTRRQREFADLDPFNQMMAVLETGAHLDELVERHQLHRFTGGAALHYTALPAV